MRVLRRARGVIVRRFDPKCGDWTATEAAGDVDRDELTVATFNIWFDSYHADQRYQAIANLLRERSPDVVVLQEVTPQALDVFLAQSWIREEFVCAEAVGDGVYGLAMLSRVPLSAATYTQLPTRQSRGFLHADLSLAGGALTVCCLHLDSGKSSARLRSWQLRWIFRSVRRSADAVLLGDFNMRDSENHRIGEPYRDVWPALRPDDPGFTEDTSINLMRLDARNKKRHVRFDRALLKGEQWCATEIELVGTEPISAALPRVFPSDHFGVWCRLVRRQVSPSTDTDRPTR
jgi:tyrosyl-DNA phosphodiesterase 2